MWSFHLIVLARLLVGSPGVISISATGRWPFSPFGSHPPWSFHSEDRDRVPDTSGSLEARRPLVLVLGAASGNAEGRAGHWGLGLTPPLCSLSSGRPQQPKRLSSEGAATFPRTSVLQPQVQVPVGPAELGGLLEGLEGTGFPKRDESLRLFILPYSLHWGVSQHSDTGSLFLAVASHSTFDLEEDSEVFKMLQENRQGRTAPRQSSSFRLLQEALEAEERGEASMLWDEVRLHGLPGARPNRLRK